MAKPNLIGRCAVVTGAGKGLGAAYARDLAAAGAAVVVNDIDRASAAAVVEDITGQGGSAVADNNSVTSWESAGAIVQTALTTFGRLDGLVNNAGLFYLADPREEDPVSIEEMVRVNLLGTIFCGQHAIQHMAQHGGGAIVNDTSGAQSGMSQRGTYGATKGATASLTYSWAMDLASSGIRVNAISPIARTAMVDYGIARGESGTDIPPAHVAPLVTFLLSDDAREITGHVIRLEGTHLSLLSRPGARRTTQEDDIWDQDSLQAALPLLLERHLHG
jgi:NAD(P)-dependent dehydrogenase (short-subunit alcohol dehydrogenase family)